MSTAKEPPLVPFDRSRANVAVELLGGVAGREEKERAIAPSMPPHALPGKAAERPALRFCAESVQAAQQRLKHAPAPQRSNRQRRELVEGTSPGGIPYHCTDKAGKIY